MKRVKHITKRGLYMLKNPNDSKFISRLTAVRDDGTIRIKDLYFFNTGDKTWHPISLKDRIFEADQKDWLEGRKLYTLSKEEMFLEML